MSDVKRFILPYGVGDVQGELMRRAAWDMYVAAALGMSMHPGTTRDAAKPLTNSEIVKIADELLMLRDQRFDLWNTIKGE